MSDITEIICENLLPNEQITSNIEDLEFGIEVTPNCSTNYSCIYSGELALSNKRLIILFSDGETWKIISIAAINNLSERPLNDNKPKWPYQAIIGLPGGYGIIAQTRKSDITQQKMLSRTLINAYLQFCVRTDDYGSIKAIEVEKEKQMQQQIIQQQQINQSLSSTK
jgi:hypothetical protein